MGDGRVPMRETKKPCKPNEIDRVLGGTERNRINIPGTIPKNFHICRNIK
jgi:hypothetical protein